VYDVLFTLPITVDGFLNSGKKATQLMHIIMKKNGKTVRLTEKEHAFFCMPIFCLAMALYSCEIGETGPCLGMMKEYFPINSLILESTGRKVVAEGTYELEPEIREMLNRKKFDCQIKSPM